MNRTALFAAGAALLLSAGAHAQRAKPAFSFMGDSTVIQTTRSMLGSRPCVARDSLLECDSLEAISWQGQRFNFVSMTFWDGRLIRAVGAFDRGQHAKVRALLARAYGRPQRPGYQTMATRPDLFTYPETVWEFEDGRLELDSLTDDAAVLLFRFSVAHPPDIEEKVGASRR
jgi:hypothetical protein